VAHIVAALRRSSDDETSDTCSWFDNVFISGNGCLHCVHIYECQSTAHFQSVYHLLVSYKCLCAWRISCEERNKSWRSRFLFPFEVRDVDSIPLKLGSLNTQEMHTCGFEQKSETLHICIANRKLVKVHWNLHMARHSMTCSSGTGTYSLSLALFTVTGPINCELFLAGRK